MIYEYYQFHIGEKKMKTKSKALILLEVELSKDVPNLTDLIASRIYILDGVEDVTASVLQEKPSEE
jgi:hypothetical protein